MRKSIFTSSIAALALFAVVGLVAALAISWPNLARAHSPGGASLTALTVTSDVTALTLTPTFDSAVHYYTVPVADTVNQITIEATPGGDGTVAYAEADGTALPDADANTLGLQVAIPTDGKRINVEVTHTDAGEMMVETYGVLVLREGPAVPDTIVLMALYDSTNGEGWTTNTNWGSTEPLSAWYQVSVNADGRVEILGPTTPTCGGNNLVGTLPAALGNLDQMEQLSLCGNQLSGPIPDLSSLTSLTHLYLNKNQLSGAIPASLDSLTSLVHLYLHENQLTGEIPASLGNLPNLQFLHLNNNELSGTIPASLGNLASLQFLHLNSNELSGTIPASLGSLTSLVHLYLHENQLTGEIPASLGNLTTLRQLYLSKNQLTGEIPTSLGNLTELRYLYLDTNQLSGTIPDLSRLTNLQHLYLWGNQLDGRIPDWLGDLTNLQDLFLNNNQLSGEIPDLSRLTNLQSLYLHQNQLSGEIPDLRRLTSLLYLFLDDNQLSGTIPSTRGLTNLQQLSLSRNQLSGRIPDLSFLTSLTRFTASQNQLDGRIPAWLGDFDNLQQLTLDQNQLSGPIPDLRHLRNLTVLQLSENQLSGEIPASLDSLTSLVLLYLHENQLTGEIPASLGNLANLKIARFASNTDAEGNPSLTGCVPGGLRFLVTADEFAPGVPAHDFIAVDANGDGDTDDPDDTPGLNLPFCMLSALDLSDVTLVPSFASGTVAYTASVANTVAATTVTATLNDDGDRLSIKKGTNSYTSGDAVPLDVGSNEITIEVTPPDAALLKQTYTVQVFREGSVESDRAALVALYKSAGGTGWTDKTNWDSAEPLNTWFGVTLLGNDRVAELSLPGNNLSRTLPAELGSLTSLNALDLSENQLRGPIPGVRGLTELTTLNLNSNRFNGPIPDWLGDFTNLMTLNLGDNQLNGLIPASLSSLSRLQELYLNGNQLSGTIPASLSNLSLLRDLYLNGNQLSGCVPDQLRAGLTNHDFIAVDANSDGDTADTGDTPGLPFCTLRSLTFSGDVTLNPEFTSSTTTYTASAAHDVEITTVTASLNNSSNTVSIMKGTDTPTTSVPLDVGSNVITIEVTRPDDPLTPHVYTVTVARQPNTPPAFDEGAAATRGVAENTGTGVDIGDPVAATDPDSGDTLTYSLDAAGAESFDIDASSGQLRTKAALDYETKNSYSVTMSVSDGKDADGNADEMTDNTITVTILVSNVNEALAFPSTTDTRTIPENTDAGVNLGAPFTATDGDNDLLTYSLGSSGNADSFSIDAVSGQLQTKAPLDYETTPSYTVTVTAEDPSGEADTITVTITVTNINEDGTVTLSTVQPLVSTQLFATLADPDRVSGSVTWSWESSPNRSSWAPINGADTDTYTPVTGDQGRYLRATASYDDQESAGKSARAVSANPVRTPTPGNSAPQFSPSETGARSVTENTPAGTDIGAAFAATDSNSGDTLTYSLDAAGAASFDITSATGQLRTKAALDYETIPLHFVTVTATDTAGGSDDIGITITVNNVDEPGTVTLSSLQPQVATQLTATLADPDSFLGSDTWSWESSSDQDSWAVISGATSADYTPVAGAAGNYLRATASYTDGEAAGKSAQAVSANAARGVPGRRAPVFTDGASTTRSVAKSTPAGRNIGAPVSATDADNDALTYSLGGPDGNSFDVGTSSGQLRTKAPLTGIRRTSYSVFVSVSDNKDDEGMPETPPQIDTTTAVTILVTEVNEAPVFPSATATRTIPENTPAGRNIGDPVRATDADSDTLTYSLGGDDAASFDIDTSSGQLRTKAALDHEAKPEYSVTVIATDASSLMAELEVTITVGNVEEEGSVALFPAQPRVGTVLRATLSDPDGELRSVNWQWERSSDQTNWTSRSGSGPSYTPTSGDEGMYLRASASYTDGEGTGKSAEAASDHSVGAHDAAPDITVVELVSGLSIPWDLAFTPDGAMLFTQRPGVLSARLTDGTVQTVTADFGDLYVSREAGLMAIVIDPSFASNRRFYTCQTHAGPTVQVIAWTINAAFTAATRVNDPLVGGIPAASFHDGCRLRFGPQGYLWIATGDGASGTVPQDLTSLGGKVLRVDASTGAGAPGNPFASSPRVYTYGHRNPQGLARRPGTSQMWSVEHGPNIDDEINLLVKGGNYGWDPVPAYNQAVPMTDLGQFPGAIEARWSSGDPTLATSGGIFLDGDDWDEWEGRLAVATLKASELHIFDFTANGTFVSQVVVLELDGTYGRLRTPMMGPDGALYLTTSNGSGDRILKVVPSLPPTFPGETDTQAVDENRSASTIVATVTATDPEGQALTYTLSGRDAASFTIPNSAAGRLRAKATLNHEDRSSYQVIVTAADPYGLSDSVTLTISVTDVNETPAFPSSETGVRRVAETTAAGVNIGAPVAATDADNDALTYSLGGTDAGSFDIVSGTGQLQTKASLDGASGNSYSVTVSVRDSKDDEGNPDTTTDSTIAVTILVTEVTEVNEAPVFPSAMATRTIPENTPAGVNIGAPVAATDADNDPLTYSLNGADAGSFDIVSGTGQLQTKASLDGASGNSYSVTVSVRDSKDDEGNPDTTTDSTIAVTILVTEVNEVNEAPVFPSAMATRTIPENTPAGRNIGAPVSATDPDNDALTYSLNGADAGSFDIDASSGQLQTKTALDYESKSSYSVTVSVRDSKDDEGNPDTTTDSTIAVTILVTEVNEAPVFPSAMATRTIPENTPAGVNIGAPVSATDADNDALTYSLNGADAGSFDIVSGTGQLQTKASLDGASGNSYSVTVSVRDSKDDEGNPDTTTDSTIAVTILVTEVTEVNEAPVFPSATATRTIPENTPAGRNIGAPVAATDPDNDALTYFLDVDGAASFDIGSTDGQLQTEAPLNRASRSSYIVIVSVSDGKDDLGEPDTAIDATTAVTINITTITTTTRPSGGSSGGGRSRATPTPTPTPSPTPTATPTPTGPQFSGLIAAEPSVTATVVPEGTTLGLNGGGDQPGGVYVNFPPTAVALPVSVSVSVSNTAPDDVEAPSGTTLLPLTINITPETPLTLGEPLTIEINPTPEQLEAAGGDLNNLAVGVVTPHGIVVLPTQVMHGRLVVTTDRIAPFVLLAVTDTGPTLTQPPMGDASSMGPLLQWTQPPGTTWFQVQVIPFNEDGPGINLVIGDGALVRAAQYQVLGPNFGSADPNYVMLPGMTYLWRVRTSTVLTNPTAADWSAWAVSSFKTPPASSSTITRVAPPFFGEVRTLTPTLTWANSNAAVFYYEVQVSKDYEFGPNAFLYSEYVHGGASTPANSYVVPAAFPLEAGEIYYWRVRPRIQGDGDPLPWSATYVFQAPPG